MIIDKVPPLEMDAKPIFTEPTFEEENLKPVNIYTSPTYNYTDTNTKYDSLDIFKD